MKKRYVLGLLAALGVVCIVAFIAFRVFRKPGPSGPTPDEIVKELLEFDRNGDGQLSKDEVSERMQGLFARGDANQDGVLSKDELRKLAEAQSEAARRKERDEHR
ncbi:MAG: EF-hand domain-containing protein [Acidobacteria bacterium]|nr:EF-hand domain-containing protein [Acidobacteriota bacterium]MBI3424522.1 EF-hand domain-containing protein [Acidobacteriota bacterium]